MAVYIHSSNCISPLGFTTKDNFQALLSGRSAIEKIFINDAIGTIYAGTINNQLFDAHFQSIDTHFNGSQIEKLLIAALYSVIKEHPVKPDSVLIFSTTKGNISALAANQLNDAFIPKTIHNINTYFGFKTEPVVISNACVSGVMALSIAKRLIESGAFSNAFVVAADELTPFVISGFQSFQAMSNEVCKPYDKNRNGINLGEAAAAVYVSDTFSANAITIAGEANINDANHISGPSRTGEGLVLSIEKALKEAKKTTTDIDYISAHGTATLYNDEMEAIAFNRMQLQNVPLNSLKAYYGHTLGASGLLESIVAIESLKTNTLVPSLGFKEQGTTQSINIITKQEQKPLKAILKTASGFGGSNSAMVFTKNK